MAFTIAISVSMTDEDQQLNPASRTRPRGSFLVCLDGSISYGEGISVLRWDFRRPTFQYTPAGFHQISKGVYSWVYERRPKRSGGSSNVQEILEMDTACKMSPIEL